MSPVPVLKKRTAGGLGTGGLRHKQGRRFRPQSGTPLPRRVGAQLLFVDSQARIVSTAKGLQALWRDVSHGVERPYIAFSGKICRNLSLAPKRICIDSHSV